MSDPQQSPHADAQKITIDLRQILSVLKKWHRMIIVATILIALATALISVYLLTPIYEADTLLSFSQAAEKVPLYSSTTTNTSSDLGSYVMPVWTMNTHLAQIKSRELMQRVIDELHLTGYTPSSLADMINASIITDSNLIQVKVDSSDPALASSIANTLGDQYLRFMNEKIEDQFNSSLNFLTSQKQLNDQQLVTAQAALGKYSANPRGEDIAARDGLQREVTRLIQTSETLNKQITNTLISKSADLVDRGMVIMSKAVMPTSPIKPNLVNNVIMALVFGLIGSTMLAFVMEYLDNTVKLADDLKEMELLVLGGIPQDDRGAGGDTATIVLDAPKSAISEAYRALRTNLGFAGLEHPLRSILITSPSPRDGKSTITANLGVVLAQAGSRVIVVDCDLRNPVQHKIFGVDNLRGLTDYMLQKLSVEEAAHNSIIKNLTVLTSGPLPPNPAELLNSQRMRDLWPLLLEKYDYVLVDTAPVLALTDASILASQMDGVIMVARSAFTRKDQVLEVLEQFMRAKANLIGVVLNQVKPDADHHYYYSREEVTDSAQDLSGL